MNGEQKKPVEHRTEDERIKSIRTMLNDPIEQTAPNNQARSWRTDCDYLLTELDDKSRCLAECIPFLRAHAKSCEACEGSGERIVGHEPADSWREPCGHCKPIWDLIERMEPPAPAPSPPAIEEVQDDIIF
jgi:hypothetical protein